MSPGKLATQGSQVNRTHVGRAVLLLRYTSDPFSDDPLIRRAFFGREVMNSE